MFAISISALAGSFNALNDPEAFTLEQRVLSKLTETYGISPVCALPIGKALIALALIIGGGCVNIAIRMCRKAVAARPTILSSATSRRIVVRTIQPPSSEPFCAGPLAIARQPVGGTMQRTPGRLYSWTTRESDIANIPPPPSGQSLRRGPLANRGNTMKTTKRERTSSPNCR